MAVTQDGDEEGCLRLLALPTPDQAALIRDALLLRKRRTLTESSRASLISAGVNGRFRAQGSATAPGLVPEDLPSPPRGQSAANPSTNAVEVSEPEEAR